MGHIEILLEIVGNLKIESILDVGLISWIQNQPARQLWVITLHVEILMMECYILDFHPAQAE